LTNLDQPEDAFDKLAGLEPALLEVKADIETAAAKGRSARLFLRERGLEPIPPTAGHAGRAALSSPLPAGAGVRRVRRLLSGVARSAAEVPRRWVQVRVVYGR